MQKAISDSINRLNSKAKNHLGLHYVVSFNDLNSLSADDLEERIMRERAERSKQSASEGTPEKQHEGQRQFEGVTSKMSDLHWVNKSVGGKRADWNYDISHPSHSPESINDIMFKHQESQEKP